MTAAKTRKSSVSTTDKDRCQICSHPWTSHDAENGCCDGPADESFQPCPCGRDLAWMHKETARLARNALAAEADRRYKTKLFRYHTLSIIPPRPGDATVRFGDWRKHEPQILIDRQQWAAVGSPESITMDITPW